MPPKEHKPHSPNLPAGIEATLVVTEGPQKGLRYHLTRPEVKIGRRKDMDLILSDSTVSSEHARIYLEQGSLWIEDLRSLNGTLLNDRRIRRAALQAKDKITVGKYLIEVEMEPLGPAPQAADRRAPAPAKPMEATARFERVWVAGYPTLEREVLVELVEQVLSAHATAFANGEQMLTELSARLSEGTGPDLILLNLKMPLISGLHTAISVRAFEEGYARTRKVPIGFLGAPPTSDAESFQRVLKFCQPASFMTAPAKIEDLRPKALTFIQAFAKLAH